MAGAGWKSYSTGDFIEATTFQKFIQDQVIQVYNNASSRDSALGTNDAEGMFCFLKDNSAGSDGSGTSELQFYNGSAWVNVESGADVKSKVSSNDTTAGFLNGKLVASTNITLTENSDGGNETLGISVNPGTTLVQKSSNTGSAYLPSGTTGQRDGSPAAGYLRFNSTTTSFEGYNGSAWGAIGGGGNTVSEGLFEHANTISANYSITSGNNAIAGGPITINSGISVTVPSGSTWTIV